jgi:hypothetical protein
MLTTAQEIISSLPPRLQTKSAVPAPAADNGPETDRLRESMYRFHEIRRRLLTTQKQLSRQQYVTIQSVMLASISPSSVTSDGISSSETG